MNLSDVAIVTTAWKRPYYAEQTLAAWERVRGIECIARFCVMVGASDRLEETRKVVAAFGDRVPFSVFMFTDNGTLGPWRTNANGIASGFNDPGVNFVMIAEEDILPGDDVLELMSWGKDMFADDKEVLLVNAHSRCGQGWDGPDVRDDPEADPGVVHLSPYFNQWGWGTWRDRFETVLLPDWDYDGTSGSATQSGHDWNIHLRTMRGHVAVVPDASRTQHIGDREAWAANEWTLSWSKAASFREHRDPVSFRIA